MIHFGFMSLSTISEHSYFTEIARQAPKDEMICYRFTPSQIHPITHLVNGEKYDCKCDEWIKGSFPIPSVIYDRCFYGEDQNSKQSKAIVNWLKSREDIVFLGYGLPNKWDIYKVLSASKLAPYIPKTHLASSTDHVMEYLYRWKKIILKPVFASGGSGIFLLEKQGESFILSSDSEKQLTRKKIDSETETKKWIMKLISSRKYLLQPYLELTDSLGFPFDIRFLIQKDSEDKWMVRGKGIRKGKSNGILSNLTAGGEILHFVEWEKTISQHSRNFLLKEFHDILTSLPNILEKAFPRLFELGIDIGVSKDLGIWILDVNSKPGRKVILNTTPEMKDILYKAPSVYALMLITNSLKERDHTYEKTISD